MYNVYSIGELKNLDNSISDNISQVHLDKMDLTEIPDKIFTFKNLQVLNISSNLIKTIPHKISNLKNLQELYLDKNLITTLPPEFGNLINLRKLIISNNQITELPKTFYNLSKLEILNIAGNQLTEIPDDVVKLSNLEYLYLRNNKLRFISKYISNIKVAKIFSNSYENFNNLSNDCEYLQIENLDKPLMNLPLNIRELRLYLPKLKLSEIKLPFGCKLYEDDILKFNI
jgi:Leucine-rich repeat (LRR) protein